jgi:hypothetical protein
MEARRVAPKEFDKQRREPPSLTLYPPFAAVILLAMGLFNFTPVNEIYIYSAVALGMAAVAMSFSVKYRALTAMDDALSWSVLSWCGLVCVSALWSVNPPFAFFMLTGYAGALFVYYTARAFVRGQGGNAASLLRVVSAAGGALSLISIEMASTGLIRNLYFGLLAPVFRFTRNTVPYGLWVEGARMQSLMGLPNLYATLAAMAFFAGMALIMTPGRNRIMDTAAVIANGAGFFLSGSRGGFLAFGMCCLLLILFVPQNRKRVLGLGVLWVLLSAATAVLLMRWMGTGSFTAWPALGLMIYLASTLRRYQDQLSGWLDGVRPKRLAIVTGSAAALAVVYGILALSIRTAFPLYDEESVLRRGVSLPPGEYTLTLRMDTWDGGRGIRLEVASSSAEEASAQISDVLYQGALRQSGTVGFTVPPQSAVVMITAQGLGGKNSIVEMSVSDGQRTTRIPLEYNLLPEALVSRMQGGLNDANTRQRLVYWKDGLSLFRMSPAVGLGGGAFEVLAGSVADYHYYTKHVHNHYLQVMLENGIFGLLAMLAALAFSIMALWKARGKNPYVPYLAAAILMMFVHSVTEASMQNLLNVSVFFLLLGILSGLSDKEGKHGEVAKAAVCVLAVVGIALLSGRLATQRYVRAAERHGTREAFDAYRWAVITDPLNASSYRASALTRHLADPDAGADELVRRFVQDMARNWNTPSDCFTVARYYLRSGDTQEAVRFFERYVELGRWDPLGWDAVLAQYVRALRQSDDPVLRASAARLVQTLEEINAAALVAVEPNEGLLSILTR